MKLTIKDRIMILGILPAQGSLIMMKIFRDLESKIGFNEEELKEYNIHNEGPLVKWNDTPDEKEIEIGEAGRQIIVAQFSKLDKEEKLTRDHISTYEKFIEA